MSARRLLLLTCTLGLAALPTVQLRLRLALSRVLDLALRLRARELTASRDTVTLILAPHQDDESLGCGGLIALRRLDARPVHVAFITDGAASHRGHPALSPARTAALRATEARAALRQLGVETPSIHFLGAPDGELSRLPPAVSTALVSALTSLLDTVRPTEVFLPLRCDGSSEHEAAFRLFTEALRSATVRPRIFEFPVWARWHPTFLLGPLLRARRVVRFRFHGYTFLKQRGLSAYRSQTEPIPPWTAPVLAPGFLRAFASPEEFFFEF